jgi:hypothetical protein
MAVQETRTLPAQFIEDLGKDLAKQVTAQSGVPVVSTGLAGISQQAGETAEDFAARQQAAREFTTRQQSLAGLAPQVAGQDADFMSPFQSQVIDATLAEFDRNKAIQEQQIRDQQTALGVLGAGRAGVQLAEFGTGAARERALLNAQLLQQGFGQAMAARQQDISNRGALAAQQQGLGGFQTALGTQAAGIAGTNIGRLGQLGALNQAQEQARLDATREAARQATFLPQEQLDRFAGQVTGIMGGYPAQFQSTIAPNPTPLQTALGVGTTLAGIYGATNPTRNLFGSSN